MKKVSIIVGLITVLVIGLLILTGCGDDNKKDDKKGDNNSKNFAVNTVEEVEIEENEEEKDEGVLEVGDDSPKKDENSTSNSKGSSDREASIESAEEVIKLAFDNAKAKSNTGNVTVGDIIDNLESGWKVLDVNIQTNSLQPVDGSKIKEYMLKIIVNDKNNDNSGYTSIVVLHENSNRQFNVRMKAIEGQNIQIPAGNQSIYQSYELR